MGLFRKKNIANILKQAAAGEGDHGHTGLNKTLTARDLTALGIAAIIGAGIFSTIGNASASGGPAVIFLFIFTAVACAFSAFAYAEFASMVPVAGSAYTYSYVAFGEIIAWLIGWSLIMEYSIGNIAVAISWSDYFTSLLNGFGMHIPEYFTMDYLSASKGFKEAEVLVNSGTSVNALTGGLKDAYLAWTQSPQILGLHIVADLPALLIIVAITALVYRGVKESKNAANLMVLVKLIIILMVIAIGAFYVSPKNWDPFAPNGIPGVLKGISAVFFAYIGFDAISTTAEECKDPQKDLPKSMMWSIIICTVLYVAIALVLTGMVSYKELGVGDPLAFVFEKVHVGWMAGIISFSAVIAMASVLLVFQLGQPRIWLSMSRDGLLPKNFSKIHPKFKTPSFATIVCGFLVAIPALFMNLTAVTDLCSIGTLFAFVLVCSGVLALQNAPNKPESKFKTPYLNSKYIIPSLVIIGIVIAFTQFKEETNNFISSTTTKTNTELYESLSNEDKVLIEDKLGFNDTTYTVSSADASNLKAYVESLDKKGLSIFVNAMNIEKAQFEKTGWEVFQNNIPYWIFFILLIIISIQCFLKNWSIIPVLGLISCLYMMSEMGISNWKGFGIWLILGVIIYFSYGYKHSKLAK